MRTLQRLDHVRPPGRRERERIRRIEAQSVQRSERHVWLNRLRRLGPWIAALLVVGFLIQVIAGARTVVDGLVVGNLAVIQAPAKVRVVEVFARPGERCRRGDALLRLQAVDRLGEREALVAEVQQRTLRLALARAGGEVGATEIWQRHDQALVAELEARLAEAEHDAASSRLDTLIRAKDSEALVLRQEHDRSAGEASSFEDRYHEARARVEGARAELGLAEFDVETAKELAASGISAERDLLAARTRVAEARAGIAEETAGADALRLDWQASERTARQAWQKILLHAEETNAEVKAARRDLETYARRRDEWRSMASKRRDLLPAEMTGGERLKELELSLLAAELDAAEARLVAFDADIGNLVVRAEFDGVIDRVHVAAGFVVAAEAELVSYYDPRTLEVVAYAQPDQLAEIGTGQMCRIFPAGSSDAIAGTIVARGRSWVSCPLALTENEDPAVDMRLPLSIDCSGAEDVDALAPNMRVRVVCGLFGGASAPRR